MEKNRKASVAAASLVRCHLVRHPQRSPFWLLAVILAFSVLPGCGGGGGGSQHGSYQAHITWPPRPVAGQARPKLVPLSAASIRITLQRDGDTSLTASQIAVRPAASDTSDITFSNLPLGGYSILSTAYPNADGTGTPVAAGSDRATIQDGVVASGTLTLNSTVAQLTLSPVKPVVAAGATLALMLSAQDAAGATVMLSASKLQWSSSDPLAATVDAAGVVTGIAVGSSSVTVTDADSGKSATTIVSVTSPSGASSYAIIDLGPGPISIAPHRINSQGRIIADAVDFGLHGYAGATAIYGSGAAQPVTVAVPGYTSYGVHGYGLNDSGQAVGDINARASSIVQFPPTYITLPYLWISGQATQIGTDAGTAYAINNSGQVTGVSGGRPFLYSQGMLTLLDTRSGSGYSISDSGQITGSVQISPSVTHAILYNQGQMQDLGTLPGFTNSEGRSINSAGQIAGKSYSSAAGGSTASHAFLYSGGALTDLGVLAGKSTSVGAAINSAGQVVGSSDNTAFLYTQGKMVDLNTLLTVDSAAGWRLVSANGINDKGQICGTGYSASDQLNLHLYLLTPIPTASSLHLQAR